jgi:hypothetical protein
MKDYQMEFQQYYLSTELTMSIYDWVDHSAFVVAFFRYYRRPIKKSNVISKGQSGSIMPDTAVSLTVWTVLYLVAPFCLF